MGSVRPRPPYPPSPISFFDEIERQNRPAGGEDFFDDEEEEDDDDEEEEEEEEEGEEGGDADGVSVEELEPMVDEVPMEDTRPCTPMVASVDEPVDEPMDIEML